MKNGFTKLETFLIGIIIFAGFFYLTKTNLFVSKENLLRQRYSKYILLRNNKNYSEAYNFLSSSEKEQTLKDDFIKDVKDMGKQKIIINKIVIENSIAYIRT